MLIQPEEELNCFEYKARPAGQTIMGSRASQMTCQRGFEYNFSLLWFCSNTHVINATDKSTDGCDSYWMNSRTRGLVPRVRSHLPEGCASMA